MYSLEEIYESYVNGQKKQVVEMLNESNLSSSSLVQYVKTEYGEGEALEVAMSILDLNFL